MPDSMQDTSTPSIRGWLSRALGSPSTSRVEVRSIPAKYVFFDIVGFAKCRSVEAQSELVARLNDIVKASLRANRIPIQQRVLLPTGDGLCIALLNIDDPYYIHMRVALDLLQRLQDTNEQQTDQQRVALIRVGINQNDDNLIRDVNGRLNVAGAGINYARRITDLADGSKILVSHTVYETLSHRELYMDKFREYSGQVKHSVPITVYQFIEQGHKSLSVDVPSSFSSSAPDYEEPRLTELSAYYFAHAIANEAEILKTRDRYVLHPLLRALLFLKAVDSRASSKASKLYQPEPRTPKADSPLLEQLEFLHTQHYRLMPVFSDLVKEYLLSTYHPANFEDPRDHRYISERGRQKLAVEWPTMCQQFGFEPLEPAPQPPADEAPPA